MTTLCQSCWRPVPLDAQRCPRCGADLIQLHARAYAEKLIGALEHPDRETVMRAAGILAARGDRSAVPALVAALDRYVREPPVAAALVAALGRFDDDLAQAAVATARRHPSVIVRRAAELAGHRAPAPAIEVGRAEQVCFAEQDGRGDARFDQPIERPDVVRRQGCRRVDEQHPVVAPGQVGDRLGGAGGRQRPDPRSVDEDDAVVKPRRGQRHDTCGSRVRRRRDSPPR